jgi:hypothetical protein
MNFPVDLGEQEMAIREGPNISTFQHIATSAGGTAGWVSLPKRSSHLL